MNYPPFITLSFVDDSGDPIISSLTIRVSLWSTFDFRNGDVTELGAINTTAPHYGDFSSEFVISTEEHYVENRRAGTYDLRLVDLLNFPDALGYEDAFLQVEYKFLESPDSDYIIYDFVFDPPFENITRYKLLDEDRYIASDAGPKTIYNSFTIDDNSNATGAVTLQFGGELGKTLSYHLVNARFELNDDLIVSGLLIVENIGDGLSFRINDRADDNTPFVIDQNGRVGVGLDDPEDKLHIAGETPQLFIKGSSTSDYSSTIRFAGESADSWRGGYLQYDASNVGSSDGRVIFGIHEANDKLTSSDIEVFSMTRPNGYVGVGIESPISHFHVPDGKYVQFEDSNEGAPPTADCDVNAERGRLSIDTLNNRIYICNGGVRGWDYIPLND